MPPFQQVSSSNLCSARAAQVICKCCYCEVEMSWSKNVCVRPHKLTEWDRQVLKRVACKHWLSTVATLTTEFQTASGRNVSTGAVCRELHEMCFHGRAAADKPKITMCNAKCRLDWCKAHRHWTLEQWKHVLWSDESLYHLAVRRTNLGLADARRMLPA